MVCAWVDLYFFHAACDIDRQLQETDGSCIEVEQLGQAQL